MKDFRLYSRLGLLIECLVDKILRSMKGFIEKTSAKQSFKIRTWPFLSGRVYQVYRGVHLKVKCTKERTTRSVHLPDECIKGACMYPDRGAHPEGQLGTCVEEHVPECCRACTKECAPSKRAYFMLRSARTSPVRAHLIGARNLEVQVGHPPRSKCK